MIKFLLLFAPGAIVAYAFFVRPALAAVPAFKKFYAEADGFWAKVWALCGKSATLAFTYAVHGVGWLLQFADPIASFLGDPDFKQQVTDALQTNPKVLGYVLMAISMLYAVARLRSIIKQAAPE